MQKDWRFINESFVCDVRTAGVLVRQNKILLQRDRDGDAYALPGGHVQIGETLEDGLIREFKEETGADIECKRLLWSEECFWEWDQKQAHTLAFYYLIALCPGTKMLDDTAFVPQKDHKDVLLGWVPLDALENLQVYPTFLKKEIHCLEGPLKHFVSRD